MNYRDTLNLLKTEFPMKADLTRREPEIQQLWEDIDIYRAVGEKRAGRPQFILHDGPPYSNGDIHLGQALNKILKDIVVKYQTMRGFDAPFVPGWDNHGLPNEMAAIRQFDIDRNQIDPVELRAKCRQTALHYVGLQRDEFKRLGVRGDWEHPYLTLDPRYEAAELDVFRHLLQEGAIHRGLKPVYWCATCETALAEAEVEYEPTPSYSLYVRFPMTQTADAYFPGAPAEPVSAAVWTTTPWTLPANLAVAAHPEFTYALVRSDSELLIIARKLAPAVMAALGRAQCEVLGTRKGADLEGAVARHPFIDRESPVVLADYVTLEQGTGLVHTAPGHGVEDFQTGKRYGLDVLVPLDAQGRFTAEGGQFAGMRYHEADEAIVAELRQRDHLLLAGRLEHSYPHCWRCHEAVIYRATWQWSVDVKQFVARGLEEIERVRWVPPWGKERMANMMVDRPDWCISRQRLWGVPVPAFFCVEGDHLLLSPEIVDHVRALVAEHGSDVWFQRPVEELLPPGTVCPECGSARFRKETDTLDVWFDSGASHIAVLDTRPGLSWPADLYLEGHDQYRGWFQESLWTALAMGRGAPYRQVVTSGFVLDAEGHKMSKSLGNVIDPQEVVATYGADILRLWVAYVDFKSDMPTSQDIFAQVTDGYRRLRNTVRFLLANVSDFDPARDAVPYKRLREVDRWALHRLGQLVARVTEAYEEYEFHRVYHSVHTFCAVDLSAFYLDVLKDTLYTAPPASPARRSAQTVLFELASALARLTAPILTHTAEDIWRHLPHPESREPSIQLADYPAPPAVWKDDALAARWDRFLAIRAEVAKAIEGARADKRIAQPLAAEVTLHAVDGDRALLASLDGDSAAPVGALASLLIVSQAHLAVPGAPVAGAAYQSATIPGLAIEVKPAPGEKCERCWLTLPSVGDCAGHPTLCRRCVDIVQGEG